MLPGGATTSAGKLDLDHVGSAANHDNDISDRSYASRSQQDYDQ